MAQAVKLHDEQPTGTALITPAEMIGQAITSGSGPEVMEKLLALQERWDARNAKKAFDDAMAELRQNMPTIVKRQEVDFTTNKGRTHYRYEDLSAVTEALSPVMAGLGLSFRWRTDSGKDGVTVTCIIAHREGHSEETTLSAGVDATGNKNPIQAIGSAVSYLQRYTLKAAVGVAAAPDDDGQSAGPRPAEPAKPKAESRDDYSNFEGRIREAGSQTVLKGIWQEIEAANMSGDWQDRLAAEIDDRIAELKKPKPAAKSASDSLDDQFPGDIDPEFKRMAEGTRV